MSADNLIAVQEIGGKWHVWMEFASNDVWEPHGGAYHREFTQRGEALDYAIELAQDLAFVEYGIQVLTSPKNSI